MKSGFARDGRPAYFMKFSLLTSIKGPPGSVIIDAYNEHTYTTSSYLVLTVPRRVYRPDALVTGLL